MKASPKIITATTLATFLLLACQNESAPGGIPGGGPGSGPADTSTSIGINDSSGFIPGGDTGTGTIDTANMPPACGDGQLDDDEACDDANHANGDGCAGDCLSVEEGWSCVPAGMPCHRMAVCGDGQVTLPEMCDDGGNLDGDGCSAVCQIEVGFKCDQSPSICTPTICGDGIQEGAETCDDANTLPFDGCDIHCLGEPLCTAGAGCVSNCGDGIKLGDEECDDGNGISGDGCSATCKVEPGFTCAENNVLGTTMTIPIVLRDFTTAHEDFQFPGDNQGDIAYGLKLATLGLVNPQLSEDGKPIFARAAATTGTPLIQNGLIHSAQSFDTWYRDDPTQPAATVVSSLVLYDDDGDGNYVNRYGPNGELWQRLGHSYEGNPVFFPLDGLGITPPAEYTYSKIPPHYFGLADGISIASLVDNDPRCQLGQGCNPCWPIECVTGDEWPQDCQTVDTAYTCYPQNPTHNFHFTSEVGYWFQYNAGSSYTLNFVGDDDLWVFINGKLAVDLGGIHVALEGSVTINDTTAAQFGLQDGGVYEIKVFHAERETYASTYKLTLSGFTATRSTCTPACGDGIVVVGEQCDDGVNDGGYGECAPGCKLGEYCGDGVIQPEFEDCDDGNFLNDACPSSCRLIGII